MRLVRVSPSPQAPSQFFSAIETVDSFIADMTVALDTGHLKSGALAWGGRIEKYNQLMRIKEELGDAACYASKEAYVRAVRL